jgi:hypothetical protein
MTLLGLTSSKDDEVCSYSASFFNKLEIENETLLEVGFIFDDIENKNKLCSV